MHEQYCCGQWESQLWVTPLMKQKDHLLMEGALTGNKIKLSTKSSFSSLWRIQAHLLLIKPIFLHTAAVSNRSSLGHLGANAAHVCWLSLEWLFANSALRPGKSLPSFHQQVSVLFLSVSRNLRILSSCSMCLLIDRVCAVLWIWIKVCWLVLVFGLQTKTLRELGCSCYS